jgi:hypothetical protein
LPTVASKDFRPRRQPARRYLLGRNNQARHRDKTILPVKIIECSCNQVPGVRALPVAAHYPLATKPQPSCRFAVTIELAL